MALLLVGLCAAMHDRQTGAPESAAVANNARKAAAPASTSTEEFICRFSRIEPRVLSLCTNTCGSTATYRASASCSGASRTHRLEHTSDLYVLSPFACHKSKKSHSCRQLEDVSRMHIPSPRPLSITLCKTSTTHLAVSLCVESWPVQMRLVTTARSPPCAFAYVVLQRLVNRCCRRICLYMALGNQSDWIRRMSSLELQHTPARYGHRSLPVSSSHMPARCANSFPAVWSLGITHDPTSMHKI
jgi:hypothetical protein